MHFSCSRFWLDQSRETFRYSSSKVLTCRRRSALSSSFFLYFSITFLPSEAYQAACRYSSTWSLSRTASSALTRSYSTLTLSWRISLKMPEHDWYSVRSSREEQAKARSSISWLGSPVASRTRRFSAPFRMQRRQHDIFPCGGCQPMDSPGEEYPRRATLRR